MQFKIEKNVPPPGGRFNSGVVGYFKWDFLLKMKKGDSVKMRGRKMRYAVLSAACRLSKATKNRKRFTTRRMSKDVYRIWRVK